MKNHNTMRKKKMKTKSIYILKIGLRLKFIRLYFDEILHTFTNP